MTSAELRDIAERFFNPATGFAGMWVMKGFNKDTKFSDGQRRGHEDAYQLLLGLADGLADKESLNG